MSLDGKKIDNGEEAAKLAKPVSIKALITEARQCSLIDEKDKILDRLLEVLG